MNKKKIMSLIMALVMIVGVFSPLTAFADGDGKTDDANNGYKKPTSTIAESDVQKDKPDSTNVTVHKLQADSYHTPLYPKGIEHDGGKIDDLSGIGSNVSELDGVKFTVYKLKDAAQLKTFIDSPTSYDTTDEVEAVAGVTKVSGTNPIITANGQGASITLEDGYYWFVESGKPDTVSSSIAVPFGLSIPVMNKVKVGTYDIGTAYLKNVHVYPKNVTGTEPEPKKTVGNEVNMNESHKVGEVQTWFLQATVPGNIQDYETFKMVDYFSEGLTYKGNVKVYLGYDGIADGDKVALTENTDYTLKQPAVDTKFTTKILDGNEAITVESGQEFEIALKAGSDTEKVGIRKLADEYQAMKEKAGDKPVKLYATVETVINEDAKMGVKIPNAYDLKFKKKGTDEKTKRPENPTVETGGKKFIKVSEIDESKKLAGAVFELYDGADKMTWTKELIAANKTAIEAGKFATKADENKEEYTATSSTADLEGKTIYLQSDSNGLFEIKGLEYSKWTKTLLDNTTEEHTHDYKIKEVKFPEGYAGNKAEFPFAVDANSYKDNATGYPENTHDAQGNQLVKNKPLTIPQTGGIGTVIFTVVGIGLMAGAVMAMKKNREEA